MSWNDIPAWVCDQCGEVLFEAREVDLIQEALVGLDRETATLVGQSSRKLYKSPAAPERSQVIVEM